MGVAASSSEDDDATDALPSVGDFDSSSVFTSSSCTVANKGDDGGTLER